MFPLPDDKMTMNHEQEDVSEWGDGDYDPTLTMVITSLLLSYF